MGLFDKLFGKKKEKQKSSKIIAELCFGEEKYKVSGLDLQFQQDIDKKNKPIGDVYGGRIVCSIQGTLSKQLTAWSIYTDKQIDGEIRFYNQNNWLSSGAGFCIHFIGANCLQVNRKVSVKQHKLITQLMIAPRIVKIGNEVFENKWKEIKK